LRSRSNHIISTRLRIISERVAMRITSQSPRLNKTSDQRIVSVDARTSMHEAV
jgi:hypothetical protein